MKLCMLVSCLIHWSITVGEYWTAKVQKGVRCLDIFYNSTTATSLMCFWKCSQTSRCCSVNYAENQKRCEFCKASEKVRMMPDVRYRYIGYTTYQEGNGFAHHTNQNLCSCYENKEEFNQPVSTLTNGGKCLKWDDQNAYLNYFPESYFTADGNSKDSAENYCRHPTLVGRHVVYHTAAYLYCNHDDPLIEKAMCAVRSCDSTDLLQCGIPSALPLPAVRSYPLVGDVFLANFKCSSLSGDNPTVHCPVSRCLGKNYWTEPSISCSNKDCFHAGQHTSYAGKRTCTESGRSCQAWALNTPHGHTEEALRNDPSTSNYCRGTDGNKPWCYTTDPDMRWETCNIPEC